MELCAKSFSTRALGFTVESSEYVVWICRSALIKVIRSGVFAESSLYELKCFCFLPF
jgi:hypothetical protein